MIDQSWYNLQDRHRELQAAMVTLLDKLDVVEKAISGVFVLAHIHNMPYSGPNYKEEYDRCRELTGTTRNEVLDEPPENSAMLWFLDVKNQEHLKNWSGKYVAVIKTEHDVIGVVGVDENLDKLRTEFYEEFGDHESVESVYFGYVHPETVLTVASYRKNDD